MIENSSGTLVPGMVAGDKGQTFHSKIITYLKLAQRVTKSMARKLTYRYELDPI